MRTICFFGIYDARYSRNRVLIRGFKNNGWNVIECKTDPRVHRGISKYFTLVHQAFMVKKIRPDFILVAFPGQSVIWIAKILFPRAKIIFDAFTSLYDSNVFDRKLYSARSLRGTLDFLLDFQALKLADIIITDTGENAEYILHTFGLRKKVIPVFVGTTVDPRGSHKADQTADISSKAISKSDHDRFIVHFHGSFIPLQGIEYIVSAAKLLESDEDIVFRIIGDGQEYGRIVGLSKELKNRNIEFLPRMPFAELMKKLGQASIALGIFGTTDKARRVIPNKVFEAMASGKAVITGDSPAIRELFSGGEVAFLCPMGDPHSLADAIITLKRDQAYRSRLEREALLLSERKLSPKVIVAGLIGGLAIC